MRKIAIALSTGALFLAPFLVFADHNTAHTIEQLEARVQELSAQIKALQVKVQPRTVVPPTVEPIKPRPIVVPPDTFDNDRSDDEIVQLNNLRIQNISGTELPIVVSAYHDFGVRCLKYESENAPSGIAFPCPVPPSVLYQIRVDERTVLLLRNRARAKISDFKIGDRINVYGFMDRDSNAVEALIMRNLDKPAVKQFIQLNNVEVLSPPSSGTPPATLVVVERNRFPCFDYGEFGTGRGESFPCPLGVEVQPGDAVRSEDVGVQPGTGIVGAPTVSTTPFPSTIYPIQRQYEIRVSQGTQILDSARNPISLGQIEVGDTLNIYGSYSRDTRVIDASVIRDLSKPKVNTGILRVTVTASDLFCIQGLGNNKMRADTIFPIECGVLYNATVSVERSGAVVAKGSTEKGFALFENLTAGGYVVRASAPGYKEGQGKVEIRSGGKHNLTLALERAATANISISALSELRGSVGRSFQATFEARGGTPSYNWSVTAGSLPPGLSLLSPPLPLAAAPCYLDPETGISNCPEIKQTTIWLTGTPTQAGSYKFELTATDSRGNRGSATFVATISGEGQTNRPPTIHGVSGPVVLKVGETGTWTVKASDPENQALSYSVVWGDETPAVALQSTPRALGLVQDATFTHVYSRPGSYSPTFTVTDNVGLSVKASISVKVVEKSEPIPMSTGEKIIKKVGEREGSFLIQKINSDSVEGLWYAAYPVPRPEGTPKILRIGDDIGYACEGVSEKLISIDFSGQTVTFNKVVGQPPLGGCPICLAGYTLIDTPSGRVPVKDLQVGMSVWTTDKTGQRVSGVITKTSKVQAPLIHQMVHLVFDDGRELFVSPGHPTVDGRAVGNLASGDIYDGVSVVSAERVPYGESATYDILPSGETGFYWANGVLLKSTLR